MKVLRYFAIFVVGPFFLDLMMNRDAGRSVGDFYAMRSSSPVDPYSLCPLYRSFDRLTDYARNNPNRKRVPEQIHQVDEVLISSGYITGLYENGAFVVDRANHEQHFFSDVPERDSALQAQFGTDISEFEVPSDYGFFRANAFYPFNLIYYGIASLGLCIWASVRVTGARRMRRISEQE